MNLLFTLSETKCRGEVTILASNTQSHLSARNNLIYSITRRRIFPPFILDCYLLDRREHACARTTDPTRWLENKRLLGDPLSPQPVPRQPRVGEAGNISREISSSTCAQKSSTKRSWVSSLSNSGLREAFEHRWRLLGKRFLKINEIICR